MVERMHQGEFIPGEKIKRKAAARHLMVYEDSGHWDSELLDRRTAIQILAKDIGSPMIKTKLKIIEARHNRR